MCVCAFFSSLLFLFFIEIASYFGPCSQITIPFSIHITIVICEFFFSSSVSIFIRCCSLDCFVCLLFYLTCFIPIYSLSSRLDHSNFKWTMWWTEKKKQKEKKPTMEVYNNANLFFTQSEYPNILFGYITTALKCLWIEHSASSIELWYCCWYDNIAVDCLSKTKPNYILKTISFRQWFFVMLLHESSDCLHFSTNIHMKVIPISPLSTACFRWHICICPSW